MISRRHRERCWLGSALLPFLAAAVAFACGSDPLAQNPGTPGWHCQTSTECHSGLTCEALGTPDRASQCAIAEQVCTVFCDSDADCTKLGSRFTCLGTCAGRGICVQYVSGH